MDWHFDTSEPVTLDVRLASGRLDVRTGETGSTTVTCGDGDATRLIVSQAGSGITVRQNTTFLGRSVSVIVAVPPGSDVRVGGGSLETSIGGGFGEVTVKGASGDIRLDHARRARLSTASGDIRVGTVDGDLTVSGASSDLYVSDVAGSLEVTLASGDLRVERVGGNARVSTASGDIWLHNAGGALVEMKSISGDLNVALPPGIRVEADLTTMTGVIRLPDPDPTAPEPQRTVRLVAHTASGDIAVARA